MWTPNTTDARWGLFPLTLAASLMLAAGGAAAADDEIAQDPVVDPLAGPEVEDRDVPGAGPGVFGEPDMQDRRAMASERVSNRAFLRALRSIAGPRAPEEVAAEPEQMDEIRVIMQAFGESRRAYLEEHREELEQIREVLGDYLVPAPERAERPGRGQRGENARGRLRDRGGERAASREEPRLRLDYEKLAEAPDDIKASAARMREIQQGGPSLQDAQAQVWAILTEAQQEHVRGVIEEMEARAEQRRAEGSGRRPDRAAREGSG